MNLRKIQIDALRFIEESLKQGKKHIFLNLPTGSGKSIIALELAKHVKTESYILTDDYFLQKQYENTFRYQYGDVESIASANQYICNRNNLPIKTHGECVVANKSIKNTFKLSCAKDCEYINKRITTPFHKTIITNYAFFLKQLNYTYNKLPKQYNTLLDIKTDYTPFDKKGGAAPFIPRKLVILDEAHKLPDQAQNAISFEINHNIIDLIYDVNVKELPLLTYDYTEISKLIHKVVCINDADTNGLVNLLNTLRDKMGYLYYNLIDETKQLIADTWGMSRTPAYVKKTLNIIHLMEGMYCRLDDYLNLIHKFGNTNLVVTQNTNSKTFDFLDEALIVNHTFHKYGKIFVYMSATIGNPENFAKRIGVSSTDYSYISLNPGWDLSNSPIYFCNGPSFKYENKDSAYEKSISIIKEILNRHPNERGIIHTGTYDFATYIKDNIKDERIVTYNGTGEKILNINAILSRENKHNTVLIGPSLYQGVDLPDDFLRFQIISKLQYPNINSALWNRRFNTDSLKFIYFDKPFVDLLQSVGRGNRNSNDYSTTYLLDGRFNQYIMHKDRYNYLPDNWKNRFKVL